MKIWPLRAAAAVTILLLFSFRVRAQSGGIVDVSGAPDPKSQNASRPAVPFWQETAGEANIAFEGYYLSGSGQPAIGSLGLAFNFKEFLPGIGVLDAALEGSAGDGLHSGTTYVALEQVPLFGWHWDFTGGDSDVSSNLLGNSANNISTPDISTRGFSMAIRRKNRSFHVFGGDDTLLGGQRIAFRVKLPQAVIGVTMKQSIGERWTFGLRYLHLETNPSVLTSQSTLFFPGHVFRTSDSLAFQSAYTITRNIKVFGELNYTAATSFTPSLVREHPVSYFAGWTWGTEKYNVSGNYVSQSVSYLPLLGYFSGDRKGPFVEGHYFITRSIELNGSADAYSNNLENNPSLPTFHSSGLSGGGSLLLPWKLNVSASISTLNLTTQDPAAAAAISDNHQFNTEVSRGFRRHTLRLSYTKLQLNSNSTLQSERFTEAEDTFLWKRLVLRGALQYQGSQTVETRNTIFVRGAVQANLKWISAYVNFEKGNDLANQSVFSTNAYASTVIGLSLPLHGGWNLQAEAFRNNLNTTLNPQNVFLFPTADLAPTVLPGFQEWSGYFRIGKAFRWGKNLSTGGGIDLYAAERVPLVGSLQGRVTEKFHGGIRPSGNVSISLDHTRSVITDASGYYAFSDVPEGLHTLGLDMDQLPTDYAPGPDAAVQVVVAPRALVRSDFTVMRLVRLIGKVTSPPATQIDSVVIRLAGTDRYTTPDEYGNFGFDNLSEGRYTLTIDQQTIPDEFMLSTPASLQVSAPADDDSLSPIEFRLVRKPEPEKPVRQVLQQQIHVGSAQQPPMPEKPSATNQTPKPKKRRRKVIAPETPHQR